MDDGLDFFIGLFNHACAFKSKNECDVKSNLFYTSITNSKILAAQWIEDGAIVYSFPEFKKITSMQVMLEKENGHA